MSTPKAKRGRPKGSGIDDTSILEDVASLIAAHPDMKPTTAIKALGFSDPSTIRRLREKFKSQAAKTPQPEGGASESHAATDARRPKLRTVGSPAYEGTSHIESRAIALDANRDHKLHEPVTRRDARSPREKVARSANDNADTNVEGKGPSGARHQQQDAKPKAIKGERRKPRRADMPIPAPTDLPDDMAPHFLAAVGAWQGSLSAFKDLSNVQMAMTRHWMNSPAVQMVLRQQLMAARMMMSCLPPRGTFQTAAITMMDLAAQPQR